MVRELRKFICENELGVSTEKDEYKYHLWVYLDELDTFVDLVNEYDASFLDEPVLESMLLKEYLVIDVTLLIEKLFDGAEILNWDF